MSPYLAALSGGAPPVAVFVATMLAGMAAHRFAAAPGSGATAPNSG